MSLNNPNIPCLPSLDCRRDKTQTFYAVECILPNGHRFLDLYFQEQTRDDTATRLLADGAKSAVIYDVIAPVSMGIDEAEDFARDNRKLRNPEKPVVPDDEDLNACGVRWAALALATYRNAAGCGLEEGLGDLLCDLMHWADRSNQDFEAALDRARERYAEETRGN